MYHLLGQKGVTVIDAAAVQDQETAVQLFTLSWCQKGKGVCQGCILSPSLFNLYAEYIMRNAGLEETQTEIGRAHV